MDTHNVETSIVSVCAKFEASVMNTFVNILTFPMQPFLNMIAHITYLISYIIKITWAKLFLFKQSEFP